MFYSPIVSRRPINGYVRAYAPSWNERFFNSAFDDAFDALLSPVRQSADVAETDKSYTISLDVPGLTREQLTIGIEDQVVRIESKADAPRSVRAIYRLPQEVDSAASEAKLENGVLTLTLAKLAPVSRVKQLTIN